LCPKPASPEITLFYLRVHPEKFPSRDICCLRNQNISKDSYLLIYIYSYFVISYDKFPCSFGSIGIPMPVISFLSPKGGTGKSTSALLLATELAQEDVGVTVIDCDPEQWIVQWGQAGNNPKLMDIIPNPGEDDLLDVIELASKKALFVLIDLEGSANRSAANAVAFSDFCIIPTQPSALDGKSAAKAIKLIKQQERIARRTIPFAVLFTRTSAAIKTKIQTNLARQLKEADICVFSTQLLERAAFKSLFDLSCTLKDLPSSTSNLQSAVTNAQAYAMEVLALVKSSNQNSSNYSSQEKVVV